MDGSTAYQYGYGKGGNRVKNGKKTMAGIVRKLERTGHKVTDLSKQGVKSIGFVGGVPTGTGVQFEEGQHEDHPYAKRRVGKRETMSLITATLGTTPGTAPEGQHH